MSTMDKEIFKIFIRMLQGGKQIYTEKNKKKIVEYASNILDKEKQKELDDLLEIIFPLNLFDNKNSPSKSIKDKITYYPDNILFMVINKIIFLLIIIIQ